MELPTYSKPLSRCSNTRAVDHSWQCHWHDVLTDICRLIWEDITHQAMPIHTNVLGHVTTSWVLCWRAQTTGRTWHAPTSENCPTIFNISPSRKVWDRLQCFVSNTVSIDTSIASIYWLPVEVIGKLVVVFSMHTPLLIISCYLLCCPPLLRCSICPFAMGFPLRLFPLAVQAHSVGVDVQVGHSLHIYSHPLWDISHIFGANDTRTAIIKNISIKYSTPSNNNWQ